MGKKTWSSTYFASQMIDPMRRRLGHAPGAARGAHATTFVTEGNPCRTAVPCFEVGLDDVLPQRPLGRAARRYPAGERRRGRGAGET